VRTKALLLLVVIVLALLAFAAPVLAAPPAAADGGLHKAHCKTMGTAGHDKIPWTCPSHPAGCSMDAGSTA
jgi:hypothetical protein